MTDYFDSHFCIMGIGTSDKFNKELKQKIKEKIVAETGQDNKQED